MSTENPQMQYRICARALAYMYVSGCVDAWGGRLGIPQTCKQAEISVTRLSTMRHGADSCSCLSIRADSTVRSVRQHSRRRQNQAMYTTELRVM